MEQVSSSSNPKIKLAISLQKKKYRDREGLFLLEGVRNAELVVKLRFADYIELCFVTPECLSDDRAREIVKKIDTRKVYEVPDSLYNKLSATDTPQGLMLVIKQRQLTLENLFLTYSEGMLLVLDQVSDPGNLGTIIRSADAMGIKGIICLNGTVDIFSPKVVRATMGSLFNIPIITNVKSEKLKDILAQQGVDLLVTALDNTARPIYEAKLYGKIAVLLGNEAKGVSEQFLTTENKKIYIPMVGGAESLNVAIAGSMIMYEHRRQVDTKCV